MRQEWRALQEGVGSDLGSAKVPKAEAFSPNPPHLTVALFSEDLDQQDRWMRALAPAERVISVHTLPELDLALAAHPIEVVVFTWAEGVAETVRRRRRGTRLIHFGEGLPSGLLEAVKGAWDIAHCENDDGELLTLIQSAMQEQLARAVRLVPRGCTLSHEGASNAHFDVLDLSNTGFAFRLPAGVSADAYLPGTRLSKISVDRGDACVLDDVDAIVRYLEVTDTSYRVGCRLAARTLAGEAAADTHAEVIRDRAQCIALMTQGLTRGGILFEGLSSRHATRIYVDHANGRWVDGALQVDGAHPSFRPLDVVSGSMRWDDVEEHFHSVVLDVAPLRFGAPQSIVETISPRKTTHRPNVNHPLRVELRAPLSDVTSLRAVVELSYDSFVVSSKATEVLPLGGHLRSVVLHLRSGRLRCRGRVIGIEPSPYTPHETLHRIRLLDVSRENGGRIAEEIVRSRFSQISDGSLVSFAETMDLFERSGFVSRKAAANLAPFLEEVRGTFSKLGAPASPVFRSVVVHEEGRLVGHLSGVQAFSRTFMYQHLAALPGKNQAGILVRSLTEHLLQHTDYEYFKFWFLSNNPYPVRVFESFGRKISDPWRCDMRRYAHLSLPPSGPLADAHPLPGLEVRRATEGDLMTVERFFVKHQHGLLVRADDLVRDRLTLGAVSNAYAELGLARTRRVFVAEVAGRLVGVALAELSSRGVNLSEGLSSFRVHLSPEVLGGDQAAELAIRLGLLRALQATYAEAGRSAMFGLVPVEDAPAYERLGLSPAVQSWCVTADRSLLRAFAEHVEEMTERAAT